MAHSLPPTRTHQPDYSQERRETALSWIRGEGLLDSDVSEGAKLLAVVGLLICDDDGRIKDADLTSAMRDPSVRQVAASILEEARS